MASGERAVSSIAHADAKTSEEIDVTPAMIAAGEAAILSELGGLDLGISVPDLAIRVYRAMASSLPCLSG
jgi:hypothetical protein